jgi:arsenate reductase
MKKKILFLCTGNSCRSQMAEGFARAFLSELYEVESAGTQKHGMNARAVGVMQEVGIDLTSHHSKTIDELSDHQFECVITVCDSAKETCPVLPGARILHMGFQDPPSITRGWSDENAILEVYRRVRNEIREGVLSLPARLGSFK